MYKDSHAIVHGRQIHELYRTSHRIYSLYRILLTVSSPELGPYQARLLLLRVKSHDFPAVFWRGKQALCTGYIANADDTKFPLSCFYVTLGQRHGENAVIFDTL